MSKKNRFSKNELLFHPAHGICKIAAVTHSGRSAEPAYCLFPAESNYAHVRFIVPLSAFPESGFHPLTGSEEARSILRFFKNGHRNSSKRSEAWERAEWIWSQAFPEEPLKDVRSRQKLVQSITGMVREFAFVLSMPAAEIADQIRKNLGNPARLNPVISAALQQILEE